MRKLQGRKRIALPARTPADARRSVSPEVDGSEAAFLAAREDVRRWSLLAWAVLTGTFTALVVLTIALSRHL